MPEVWLHIAFAPKDGRRVRVKSDIGSTHVARFKEPQWWVMGDGAALLGDAVRYDGCFGDIVVAVQFQELPHG